MEESQAISNLEIHIKNEESEEIEKKEKKEKKEVEQKEVKVVEINNIGESINEENINGVITIEDIIRFLGKEQKFKKYINIFIKVGKINEQILKEMKLIQKKKKSEIERINEKNEIKEGKTKGRKKFGDNSQRKHNKSAADNIIKKIKKNLLKMLVQNINSILEKLNQNYKLKPLYYKENVNNINKQNELKYLYMPIGQLLSGPISSKYTNFESNFNEEKIKNILNKESDNEIIKYIFNLTFKEYIDIFTMKKEPRIKDVKFDGLDSFFENILKKNDGDQRYFIDLVFCLYNYERWFICKNKRVLKKVSKDS